MNPEDTLSILNALSTIAIDINRIANVLEAKPIPAPDIVHDLSKYKNFDWASINAEIVAKDKHGAIAVRHCGKLYTRRNPTNIMDIAIWYSRATGKEGTAILYERLITFKKVKVEAELLNDKTLAALRQAAAEAAEVK